MTERTIWVNFIKALRPEQDGLRTYLASFEAGATVSRSHVDWTSNEMAIVKREIDSLQATIDRVMAERGFTDV